MYVVLVWMLLPRSHIPRALGTRVHVEPNRAYVPPPLWPWGDNLCTPGSRTPRFGSKQKGGFLTSPLLLQLNIDHGHGPGPGSAAA